MPFEFPPAMSGSGPSLQVLDPGGAPNTIIKTTDAFTVRLRFAVDQPGASLLGGQWLVRAYAESVGPGQEQQIGNTVAQNVSAGVPGGPPARLEYTVDVNVPAGTLDDEGAASSGVYKLAAIVTHQNFGGPTVLAGFVEGPIVQLREP
jgi:hypothetical protein